MEINGSHAKTALQDDDKNISHKTPFPLHPLGVEEPFSMEKYGWKSPVEYGWKSPVASHAIHSICQIFLVFRG